MRPLNIVPPSIGREIAPDENFPIFDITDLGAFDDDGRMTPIAFPDFLEHYGFKHGDQTAKLALVILSHHPQHNTLANQRAVWTAAIFHDIGRSRPGPDPTHPERGERILEHILRNRPDLWADEHLRHEACRLVRFHSQRPESHDVVAQALWDADCYEASRFSPGTPEGLRILKERTALTNLCSEWSKNRDHLRRYMEHRGW